MGELQVNPDASWVTSAVEGVAFNFVDLIRGVSILALVIIIGIIAFMLFGAHGRSDRVQNAKSMAIYGVVALILAVYVDKIVGFILYMFGIDAGGNVTTSMANGIDSVSWLQSISHFL